jgi:hypothetical protein
VLGVSAWQMELHNLLGVVVPNACNNVKNLPEMENLVLDPIDIYTAQ